MKQFKSSLSLSPGQARAAVLNSLVFYTPDRKRPEMEDEAMLKHIQRCLIKILSSPIGTDVFLEESKKGTSVAMPSKDISFFVPWEATQTPVHIIHNFRACRGQFGRFARQWNMLIAPFWRNVITVCVMFVLFVSCSQSERRPQFVFDESREYGCFMDTAMTVAEWRSDLTISYAEHLETFDDILTYNFGVYRYSISAMGNQDFTTANPKVFRAALKNLQRCGVNPGVSKHNGRYRAAWGPHHLVFPFIIETPKL